MSDKDPGEMKELDLEKFKTNREFEVIVAEEKVIFKLPKELN